jgi:predicted metal-dependent hydrolase
MKLDYEIVYSERRTIGITVERDRRVVVRAPREARPETVASAVERKRLWIWDKLRDPRKFANRYGGKEFVAGEAFFFLGQNYSLELVREPRGEVRLNGRRFELSLAERKSAADLFRAWYTSQARKHLSPRVATMANAMGIAFRRIAVRDLKYSWGSCSTGGTLTFNWRIVQAPTVVVDYLIAHELAHCLEPNHSQAFWNIVAVHAPAWEKARAWLRRNGARLEW